MKVKIINSFTHKGMGGNPAGVIIDLNNALKENEMQAIAYKLAFSETAFISKRDDSADYHLRFFTPTNEVDLCGHATIASFWHLAQTGQLNSLSTHQITKAGRLAIELLPQSDGSLLTFMAQNSPVRVDPPFEYREALIEMLLNTKVSDTLPIEIWSTGLKDIFLPLSSRESLNTLTIDYDKLTQLSETLDVVGVHAFAVEDDRIFARNFAPRFGIDEESATGTSNGALTAYLQRHLFPEKTQLSLHIIQGEAMNKTSGIYTRWEKSEDHVSIWVGGYCTLVDEIEIG